LSNRRLNLYPTTASGGLTIAEKGTVHSLVQQADASFSVTLDSVRPVSWGRARHREPVSIGIPLPAGQVRSVAKLSLESAGRGDIPLQARPLDLWPDGSVRWLLLDFAADLDTDGLAAFVLRNGKAAEPAPEGLRISENENELRVSTGIATFGFSVGGAFPFTRVDVGQTQPIACERSGLQIDLDGQVLEFVIATARVVETGPLRAVVELGATSRNESSAPLTVSALVEVFAGSATLRVELTIRNHRRAHHPNGVWVLGDSGSLRIRSASLKLAVSNIQRIQCAPEFGSSLEPVEAPFAIYQESSGGENWRSPVHRNREGIQPLRFRGYHLQAGESKRPGHRATPIVVIESPQASIAVTMPQFWQNFPRSITVDDANVELGLFPRQAPDEHELQGGEQKTFLLAVAFDRDPVSEPPLSWCHDPQFVYPSPEWSCRTEAIPLLVSAARDPNRGYLALVASGLDSADGFFAKRERADEYGWRHFGDLPGDHESAFQPAGQWLVSHYNNQYDAILCFAIQFLRTGDHRWHELMMDLARHVRDIDIYHTTEDKAAYSGGLFWHTLHYADAGTATHRTYPLGSNGGGPSNEHNYNAGLMVHHFVTGHAASRDAAIGLGQWVIDMDDGSRTVFRFLSAGPTGLASSSGSLGYQGPGRGAANSILACLVAHRLSGRRAFAAKVDELIRRCVHPADDLASLNPFNIEERWYYTVFLQALGFYLEQKAERREFDSMFAYAKSSLLHYARWMAEHERPYLDHPERLEFPNETWAAQDLRKADVLLFAARHAPEAEGPFLLERARQFFDYAVGFLAMTPKHRLTRPLILLMSNGVRFGWFLVTSEARLVATTDMAVEAPRLGHKFTPQKRKAIRRAKALAAAAMIAVLALAVYLVG
jgi:PcRGLX-like N-terminal RIFT barrel domain